MKLKYYIESFRLRTLPLSLSGIFLGSCAALGAGCFSGAVFGWAVATTLSLQILSNLANELGDLLKGTDNARRLGPIRSVQRGALSRSEMIRTIVLFAVLSAVCGLFLVGTAYRHTGDARLFVLFLLLGLAAIVSALAYTLGGQAYGYRGLGDLFVFLFFGWAGSLGSYCLYAGSFPYMLTLPASAVGLLSVGVLNLNNMRDMENDAACGKRTLPVRLGLSRARGYHALLIVGSFLAVGVYFIGRGASGSAYLFLLTLPLFGWHLREVFLRNGRPLDRQMPVLSLSTLLFSLLTGAGIWSMA